MEDKSVHKFGQFNEHIEVLSADDEPVQGPHRPALGARYTSRRIIHYVLETSITIRFP